MRTIGRYEIIAELGRGGMATVYHARDPFFHRDVALKILPPELSEDPSFRTRFENEARVIASLEHHAIVPIYDFGEAEGQVYFVMRLMTGKSLVEKIASGPLSLEETLSIVKRVASGLDAAHSRKIVHRDLKPGNILFDQRGESYLADFGLAKKRGIGGSMTGSAVIGTPAYMSPEQGQGGQEIDGRSDIYSLGVVVYEMLTGRVPFTSENPFGQIIMHLTARVPDILEARPDLPPGVDRVIRTAMAKLNINRYATASELVHDLELALQEHIRFLEDDVHGLHSQKQDSTQQTSTPTPDPSITGTTPDFQDPTPSKNAARGVKRPTPPNVQGKSSRKPSPLPQPTPVTKRPSPPPSTPRRVSPALGTTPRSGNRRISPVQGAQIPVNKKGSDHHLRWFALGGVILLILAAAGFPLILNRQPSSFFPLPSATRQMAQTPQPTTAPAPELMLSPSPTTSPRALFSATIQAAETTMPTPSPTQAPTETSTSLPGPPVIGEADMLAWISGGDVYRINLDGSGLERLTQDGGVKIGLNWAPDGDHLVYINGTCVYRVNIFSAEISTILCANWAIYVAGFEISPDGAYVAFSLFDGLYVLPYDLNTLGQIRRLDQLQNANACQVYTESKTKAIRWSNDGARLAVIVASTIHEQQVDLIRVLDILPCGQKPQFVDEFPGTRFEIPDFMRKRIIQSFGWDGNAIFALNINSLNTFGEFYRYNILSKRGDLVRPMGNRCCFRDFTWSPDDSYILFAYQDNRFGQESQLYYLQYTTLGLIEYPVPLPVPQVLLLDPNIRPQAVLRPARSP
jgi:serine/threonine protein kinase